MSHPGHGGPGAAGAARGGRAIAHRRGQRPKWTASGACLARSRRGCADWRSAPRKLLPATRSERPRIVSGIAGICDRDGRPVDPDLLARMTDAIAHRWPDGTEYWIDGSVGFGHQMLCTTPESLRER